jgi:hypothetical protein
MTIVIQIMNVYFKVPAADLTKKLFTDFISLLRDDLKGGLDSSRLVQIHERSDKISSRSGFDVMRHNRTALKPIRPKPNEWDIPGLPFDQREFEKAFQQEVNRSIDRPMRKRSFLPAGKMNLLGASSQERRHGRTHQVVQPTTNSDETRFQGIRARAC